MKTNESMSNVKISAQFRHLAFKFNLIPGKIIRFSVHLFITKSPFGKDFICQKCLSKIQKRYFFIHQERDLIHFSIQPWASPSSSYPPVKAWIVKGLCNPVCFRALILRWAATYTAGTDSADNHRHNSDK